MAVGHEEFYFSDFQSDPEWTCFTHLLKAHLFDWGCGTLWHLVFRCC